jgi:hypothetical protein
MWGDVMTNRNRIDICMVDMLAANELMNTRLGYCPEIDPDTRRILQALREDIDNLQGTMDPEQQRDQQLAALFITEILQDILTRNQENTRLPESVVWIDRYR